MSRSRGAAVVMVLLLAFSGSARGAAEPGPIEEGLPLAEALAELKSRGLPILFTDAVVRPEMRVKRRTRATEPRRALDEILDGHPLEVREMPDGQLVIVRKKVPVGSVLVTIAPRSSRTGAAVISVEAERILVRSNDAEVLLEEVPVGRHLVRVELPGFLPETGAVSVEEGRTAPLRLVLEPIIHLEQIEVAPAHLALRRMTVSEQRHLSSEEIDRVPHVGDDVMRAVASSPGVTGSDLSAKFNPRGGGETETLVMLDGVELYEPFHLKDFLSIFSIVDTAAVDRVDLLTGAFTAEYGDRMSAVMDISIQDAGSVENELMLGTLNSRFFTSGRFNRGRGEWLATARGWYPSQLPDSTGLLEGEIVADYYDLLARIRHPLGKATSLAIGVLSAYDDLSFDETDEDGFEFITAKYRSDQAWMVINGIEESALEWRANLSFTEIERERRGEELDVEDGRLTVSDDRNFRSTDLRADASWSVDDRHLVRWGAGIKSQTASYDYHRMFEDPSDLSLKRFTDVVMEPDGYSYHAYLSDRFRLGESVIVELGLRWDHQDWSDDSQLSPRANLKVDLSSRTDLRVGWGIFHQSQRLNELPVEDGVDRFSPAERSEHFVLSASHALAEGWLLRGVLYDKKFERLRPRFENMFSRIELFPESREDRVRIAPDRAHARGLELVVRNAMMADVSWWLGYTLSEANDVIDGREIPRSWDQTHSIDAGIAFDLPGRITVGIVGAWHSGRPTTPVSIAWEDEGEGPEPVVVAGARNTARLGDYGRIDLRLSRMFQLRRGSLRVVAQAFNATNRDNVCYIEDFEIEGEGPDARVVAESQNCSPVIPSLSVHWRF